MKNISCQGLYRSIDLIKSRIDMVTLPAATLCTPLKKEVFP